MLLTYTITAYNLLRMTLLEVRQKLHDLCQDAGGFSAWARKNRVSLSYVHAVVSGSAKPGKKVLRAMGLRKAFSAKKTSVMKFEDI